MSGDPEEEMRNDLVTVCLRKALYEEFWGSRFGVLDLGRGTWVPGRRWGGAGAETHENFSF